MEDMARDAHALLPERRAARHALGAGRGDRPDPARGRRGHGRYTVEQLRKRGIDIRLDTRLESCVDGHVVLSDGDEFEADTIVWTAGVKAHPMLDRDRPAARRARAAACATRRRCGSRASTTPGAAGDCAAVPDLTTSPGHVHQPERAARGAAGRSALADNIVARPARQAAEGRTSTSTSARSRASACTRASPRSTASRSAACRPGSCTAPTT